jgi:formate hydrogenlyase subunit 4
MIHEVMILDYSGPDLAFMVYAAGMKMMLIALLIANLCIPPYFPSIAALFLFIGVLVLIYIAVGVVESLIARSRMSHVPQFIFLMTALSLTAFAVVAFFLRGGFS